ncbi:hypothetical protein [Fannyhessea vaginae]|uniref:hypothetical protein n=1 Tax=Fannyhessea vaginae TaxID=82135 RepID=UPI00206D0DE0|nr:hypothetical protein [Fannyhessea vaginae]DAR41786.1 MAG TPA: putative HTH-type transcriptional regulator [Caudoviricetes sp.]
MKTLTLEGYVAALLVDSSTTRKELAQVLGCTPETLKKKLTGKSELTVQDASVIAKKVSRHDVFDTFDELCRLAATKKATQLTRN